MCKLYLFYNYHHVRQCHDPRKLMLRSFKRSSIVTQSHFPFKVWKWKRLFWQRYDSKRSDGSNNSICKHQFKTLFKLLLALPSAVLGSSRGNGLSYTSFDIMDVYEAMLNKVWYDSYDLSQDNDSFWMSRQNHIF